MQTLTRRLRRNEVSGVKGYKNARVRDLALDNSAEPLNVMVKPAHNLSLSRNVEGHSTPKGGRISPTLRVPVVGVNGEPLMPTTPQRARKLIDNCSAKKQWSKVGYFYIRLLKSTGTITQPICLAIDPGSKWDGVAVISKSQVLTCGTLVLPSLVSGKLKQRRELRKSRRYRKTPRRAARFKNRHWYKRGIIPSQKAKIDFRKKIVHELYKLYPIKQFVVEDTIFNIHEKSYSEYSRLIGVGRRMFYQYLQKFGAVTLYSGIETAKFREKMRLWKSPVKGELSWKAHAVDAIAIGCTEIGCNHPFPPEFLVWKRFQNPRRQLHKLQPRCGGLRARVGGTRSLYPFKKADVVKWNGKLARIGGYQNGRLSLHHFDLNNVRFTSCANPEDCTRLFNQQIFYRHDDLSHMPP